MTDLTKITTPFGLLDAETQAALRAHGGPYEAYVLSGWGDFPTPSWWPERAYRVKPAPPKPREQWCVDNPQFVTEDQAKAFLAKLQADNPHIDFGPITHWIEVLP